MKNAIMKSLMLSTLAVIMAAPASAQYVRADIGGLHIRIAGDAPPPLRHEYRPPQPYRGYVWIAGYWDRRDDQWEWMSGRWERPYDRHTYWVRARYAREGQYWRYEPGHWSNQRLDDDDYRRWQNDQRMMSRRR